MAGMTSNIKGLTGIISQINAQQKACDATSQKDRKIKDKKNTFTKAKQNLLNAQPNFDRAEKDYKVSAHGQGYYSDMQEKKYKNIAQAFVNKKNVNLAPSWTDIDNKLAYYKGLNAYSDNAKTVYENYDEKYTRVVDEIRDTIDKKNVDYRLAHFYNSNTTVVNSILYYLKIIYWVSYVALLFLFVFKKQYKNIKSWPFIILVPLFPLLFEWGISFRNPFKKEQVDIPSIHDFVFELFTHAKVDNIYFIFFTLIILTIAVFSYFSGLPFVDNSIRV
jgi:hypothetical protein